MRFFTSGSGLGGTIVCGPGAVATRISRRHRRGLSSAFNISSLYSHLGQMDAATEAIGRAMARLSGPERLKQMPRLLTHLAVLQAEQDRMPQALDLYRQAIAAADRAGDQEMYAFAWNDLGLVYLEHGQIG